MSEQRKDEHDPNRASMRPAWAWTCDHCGRDNYCPSVIYEIDEEEVIAKAIDAGYEEDDVLSGDVGALYQSYPDHVICDHCQTHYETENFDDT